jgi:hypothetical protein
LKVTPGDMRAGAQAVEERTPIHSTVPSSAIGRGPSCRWRVSCPHGHALSRRVGRVGPGVWVLARVPLLGSVRAKRAGQGCPVRRGREAAEQEAGRLTQRSLLGQHRPAPRRAFLPVKAQFSLLFTFTVVCDSAITGAPEGVVKQPVEMEGRGATKQARGSSAGSSASSEVRGEPVLRLWCLCLMASTAVWAPSRPD